MKRIKKMFTLLMVCCMLSLCIGCGDTKVINGKEYDTYGILNMETDKNPNIQYRAIIGNCIWSVILFPLGTVYFVGFSIYEPIGLKKDFNQKNNGIIK